MAREKIRITGAVELKRFRRFTESYGVEFNEFASFVTKARITADMMAATIRRGVLEGEHAATFFNRVLHSDPRPDTVIPYRGVLDLYIQGVEALVEQKIVYLCPCEKKCGLPVMQKGAHLARGCPTRFKVGVIW